MFKCVWGWVISTVSCFLWLHSCEQRCVWYSVGNGVPLKKQHIISIKCCLSMWPCSKCFANCLINMRHASLANNMSLFDTETLTDFGNLWHISFQPTDWEASFEFWKEMWAALQILKNRTYMWHNDTFTNNNQMLVKLSIILFPEDCLKSRHNVVWVSNKLDIPVAIYHRNANEP